MHPPDAFAALLPHLDREVILDIYDAAPGSEVRSGKFANPASSAALAANVFGKALFQPEYLSLPGQVREGEALSIFLEGEARFPWSGGRHPSLDVLVFTSTALIGIEAKRYEPYRSRKTPEFSAAFDRDVWTGLEGFDRLRRQLIAGEARFEHLDATQLIKHALGLKADADRKGLQPHLVYLYAEPDTWPDGRGVTEEARNTHRDEIESLATTVAHDAVAFTSLTYRELLTHWQNSEGLADHAASVLNAFDL